MKNSSIPFLWFSLMVLLILNLAPTTTTAKESVFSLNFNERANELLFWRYIGEATTKVARDPKWGRKQAEALLYRLKGEKDNNMKFYIVQDFLMMELSGEAGNYTTHDTDGTELGYYSWINKRFYEDFLLLHPSADVLIELGEFRSIPVETQKQYLMAALEKTENIDDYSRVLKALNQKPKKRIGIGETSRLLLDGISRFGALPSKMPTSNHEGIEFFNLLEDHILALDPNHDRDKMKGVIQALSHALPDPADPTDPEFAILARFLELRYENPRLPVDQIVDLADDKSHRERLIHFSKTARSLQCTEMLARLIPNSS